MPESGDGTIELDHADASAGHSPEEESFMDPEMARLLAGQLAQSGVVAQNNFITTAKALDYDFIEGKRMVTLEEAVGVREVAATQSPGGPTPRA